jgi:hypothetical protein
VVSHQVTCQSLQAVSSRPDVTPPDYLKELEKLQDQIPAFDSKEAMKMMEEELGCPTSRIFSSLATLPTAAASLGQVCLLKTVQPKLGRYQVPLSWPPQSAL